MAGPMTAIELDMTLAHLRQAAVYAGEAFGPCFELDESAQIAAPPDAAADIERFTAFLAGADGEPPIAR
jgi:hypothetical protein